MIISLDIVLSKVFRKNKITDQSRSDGRCKEANEFHQDSGALSNRTNSPVQVKSENQSFIEEKSEAYHLAQVKLFVSGYLSLLSSSCYARCISRLLIGWERLYICLMTWKTIDKFKLPFFPRMLRYVNFFLFQLIMRIFKRTWTLKN